VKAKIIKWVLPFIIIFAGLGLTLLFGSRRPDSVKEEKKEAGALVNVINVSKSRHQVVVEATGTVQAAREISVVPEVSGLITYVSPYFVAGGFIQKGEIMFQISDADYKLAIEQARAKKVNAEYELSLAESRALIARAEWERIADKSDKSPNPLVLYEPQLKNARAALAAADAALQQAQLELERTRVAAPFNCIVRSESVETGQYVKSGSSVAVIAGTDSVEIAVPLALEELRWLDIPIQPKDGKGSLAVITVRVGDEAYQWTGHIVRSQQEVDEKTRMVRVVIEVKEPYRLSGLNQKYPLAINTFVEVSIKGKTISGGISIPKTAFREDSTVWVMDSENKLRIKKVTPLRIERERVIIGEGLGHGDIVVITNLSGAAEGMKLRTSDKGNRL
jgi:RND family efflux transporter MFP subunit